VRQSVECRELPQVVSDVRVYQIRTPGSNWLEVDAGDYERLKDMRVFDRRVLGVIEEVIKG
jgi:hypothetical protein